MTAIVSCLAGVLGMLALWSWAWRLWQRSVVPLPTHEDRYPRLVWNGELNQPRRHPTPPPSWLFEDSQAEHERDAVPRAHARPSSNTNTSLFAREREKGLAREREKGLAREREKGLARVEEPTEVLSEDQIFDPGQTHTSLGGKTRTIGLFAAPHRRHP